MNQDYFSNLPSSIITDIFSRLPIRTIPRCKCVCKSWLDLLEAHDFAKHHLSNPASGLAVYKIHSLSKLYEIYVFEDNEDLQRHDHHYNLLTQFKLPFDGALQGSANGFLLLRTLRPKPDGIFICNPITREYVEIHCPQEFSYSFPQVVTFGFGASKISWQHKVVRVFHDCGHDQEKDNWGPTESECQVYTLGTGSWRRVEQTPPLTLMYSCRSTGALLNGNLHWFVLDSSDNKPKISCFDLETERFSMISLPPPLGDTENILADVFALGDWLCVCEYTSEDAIYVWLMKEYGVEESWRKEYVIRKPSYDPYEVVRPIKVFKDGDVLMAWGDSFLFYSSSKTGTRYITEIELFEAGAIEAILHKPTFLSLACFGMKENVCRF